MNKIEYLKKVVAEQAEDCSIWFFAEHITEEYLQNKIRLLHTIIESEQEEFDEE